MNQEGRGNEPMIEVGSTKSADALYIRVLPRNRAAPCRKAREAVKQAALAIRRVTPAPVRDYILRQFQTGDPR